MEVKVSQILSFLVYSLEVLRKNQISDIIQTVTRGQSVSCMRGKKSYVMIKVMLN